MSDHDSNSSRRSSRARTPLSLDLSAVPPYQPPTPPSNTLIITNLNNLSIFHAENLQTIRELMNSSAPVHTFSPLKSFRRIIVSFYSIDSAIRIRQLLDGEPIMGNPCRIYFGTNTPIEHRDAHLALPDAGKLFFISPPPSPPHGWEMKMEDAPNKQVHAEDLAEALAKLHARPRARADSDVVSPASDEEGGHRKRSGSSTMIYDPAEHGGSPALPAIAVEDFTDEPESLTIEKPILAHTARPPVELMHDL